MRDKTCIVEKNLNKLGRRSPKALYENWLSIRGPGSAFPTGYCGGDE